MASLMSEEGSKLTSPRFPASRTYSSRTSCSSGDRDSSPVAPGLLSTPDIVACGGLTLLAILSV